MPTVEIATGEVIVLSDRPEVMSLIDKTIDAKQANCVEALEYLVVEGNHPVVVIDEKAYRGCDVEALILDLSEFSNDRVGGIVMLAEDDYPDREKVRVAGVNRFVSYDHALTDLEQKIGEARAERWRERDMRRGGLTF